MPISLRLTLAASSIIMLAALIGGAPVQAGALGARQQDPPPPAPAPTAPPAKATVIGTYTLPPTPLSAVEPHIQNDRKFMLGSIGSDIWHGKYDAANRFWLITDRGPNDEIKVDDKKHRTFPVPDYTPAILQVQTGAGAMKILRFIPIVDPNGVPVTGLSNLKKHDDKPYGFDGKTELERNPNGLDPEALVRTGQGDFWVTEEYGPSLVHIAADGKVIQRYVPHGLNYENATYPVADTLPSIFGWRNDNRGFEGLTLSPDGKTLYIALQSALNNPNSDAGNNSRNTRILVFDIPSATVTAEYVYRFEPWAEFDPSAKEPNDMKLSALAMLNANTLIVQERTDEVTKFYAVDLNQAATNILGTPWDDPAQSPSLENTPDLAAAGITPLAKRLVVDLSQTPGVPGKVEGIALLGPKRIAVANDNDFNIGPYDSEGNTVGAGEANLLVVLTLDKPLK